MLFMAASASINVESTATVLPFKSFFVWAIRYADKNAYNDSSEHFLSGIRRRDEIWLRLRWTF